MFNPAKDLQPERPEKKVDDEGFLSQSTSAAARAKEPPSPSQIGRFLGAIEKTRSEKKLEGVKDGDELSSLLANEEVDGDETESSLSSHGLFGLVKSKSAKKSDAADGFLASDDLAVDGQKRAKQMLAGSSHKDIHGRIANTADHLTVEQTKTKLASATDITTSSNLTSTTPAPSLSTHEMPLENQNPGSDAGIIDGEESVSSTHLEDLKAKEISSFGTKIADQKKIDPRGVEVKISTSEIAQIISGVEETPAEGVSAIDSSPMPRKDTMGEKKPFTSETAPYAPEGAASLTARQAQTLRSEKMAGMDIEAQTEINASNSSARRPFTDPSDTMPIIKKAVEKPLISNDKRADIEMPDEVAVTSNQAGAILPLVARGALQNPEEVRNLQASLRTQDIALLVNQIVSTIRTLETKDMTSTQIVLKQPPLFEGATLTVTQYASATKEYNIVFSNLSPEARRVIELKDNEELLRSSLVEKGYTLRQVTVDERLRFDSTLDPSSDLSEDSSSSGKGKKEGQLSREKDRGDMRFS